MCSKSGLTVTQHVKREQYVVNENEYDSKRIANIICHYQELRSAAEITAAQYRQISSGGGFAHGNDDLVCMLADIDQGAAVLSSRQSEVLKLLKKGYQVVEISKMLGIRPVTVKFHLHKAVLQLMGFLNTSYCRKKGAKK